MDKMEQENLLIKLEEIKPIANIEITICRLLKENKRGENRINIFEKVIDQIKELQEQRGIIDFTKKFLDDILKDYNLNNRTRRKLINEILEKAKTKREGVLFKNILDNKGVGNCSELRWKEIGKETCFYSFL